MSANPWMNPAGGLRYHLRALRHAKQLWQPFRWAIGEWLLGWEPPEKTLIVVGSSAGYAIQLHLFERFAKVICLEPDPLARFLLARRLNHAPLERRPVLEFIADDRLLVHPERLPELLESLGEAAVLFSNVLGQLRVLLQVSSLEAPELHRIRVQVRRTLSGRSWASFHDRVSGPVPPSFDQPLVTPGRMTDAEILSELYAPGIGASSVDPELLDHLTEGLFPADLEHTYFSWELTPGWFHLIEGIRGWGVSQFRESA